jgi:hypothetical protein
LKATNAERAAWQRQAARSLAAILAGHPHLPVITWTLSTAGATLTGHITTGQSPHHTEQIFTAWATALDLTWRPIPHPASAHLGARPRTHLRAQGQHHGTPIGLTATIDHDPDL